MIRTDILALFLILESVQSLTTNYDVSFRVFIVALF